MIDLIIKTALYFKRTVLIRVGGIGLEPTTFEPPRYVNKKIHPNRVDSSVGGIGLEPTTFAMSTQRSNQLS